MWPLLQTTFPKRAWQATLAGTADDPGGARGRPGADGRQRTPEDGRGRSSDGGVVSDLTLAGPARPWRGPAFWYSQKELGGRPWRGRRTTLAGRNSGTPRCGPH